MFQIAGTPMETEGLKRELADLHAGALAIFEGWVRDNNEGRTVAQLEYEVSEELAIAEAARIFREARQKFSIIDIVSVHRSGKLKPGDLAVWVGVTAAHRKDAFAACEYVIDQIKLRLPIWKKETYSDGSVAWIGCNHKYDSNHHLKEEEFYARQILLPDISENGQQRLKASKILVIGAGGLGSAALLYLAGAGIGTLDICEFDTLAGSNLHRQILYKNKDIGSSKAFLARQRLLELNPFIKVQIYDQRISKDNAVHLFSGYDLILDCSDNIETKLLLSEAAFLSNKPLIQASVYYFEGQIYLLNPDSGNYVGQCLRCLWTTNIVDNSPPRGVVGPVPGVMGSMQALEAIKFILNLPSQLAEYVLLVDLSKTSITKIKCFRNPDCPVCSPAASPIQQARLVHA